MRPAIALVDLLRIYVFQSVGVFWEEAAVDLPTFLSWELKEAQAFGGGR